MKQQRFTIVFVLVLLVGGVVAYRQAGSIFVNMWLTPSQQFQRAVSDKNYDAASERAVDPMQKGFALYRAGKFKEAGAVFGAVSSAEALYNRGNSFMMQGQYDAAIASYQKALELQPAWQEAAENLTLAQLRREKMAAPEDDHGGTGGMLEADEIVIGDRDMKNGSSTDTDNRQGGQELSENEQLALWLRKVQTRPADFLRLKFSYQLSRQEQ